MKLNDALIGRIERAIAALEPEPVGHVNFEARQHRALPLLGTIGEVWLLRPDGSFWRSDTDFGLPFQPLPEELHTIALVAGVARYPWLQELLPSRPDNAVSCAACGGSGRIGPEGALFCRECDALGWVSLSNETTR